MDDGNISKRNNFSCDFNSIVKMYLYTLFFIILPTSSQNITITYKKCTDVEEMKITPRIHRENNLAKSVKPTIIISNTVKEKKIFIDILNNFLVKNFKLHRKIDDSKGKNVTPEMPRQRKSRDAMNGTDLKGLECLSCFADGISTEDENCYKGSQ